MYIHFEDWTDPMLLQKLEGDQLPHGGRIIKAFSSDVDPRAALGRSALTTIESSGEVFTPDEAYSYANRETFSGDRLEERLALYGLNQVSQRIIRSLFRFSNTYGFCQAAMAAKKPDQEWLIRHPFQEIDGISMAQKLLIRERLIHLDIFFPDSLKDLKRIVDYDNQTALVGKLEWMHWLRKDPTLRRRPAK